MYLLADAHNRTTGTTKKICSKGYPVDERCSFSFSYFMKGGDGGTLQLRLVLDEVSLSENVWERSGNTSDQWRTQRLVIKKSGVEGGKLCGTYHVRDLILIKHILKQLSAFL